MDHEQPQSGHARCRRLRGIKGLAVTSWIAWASVIYPGLVMTALGTRMGNSRFSTHHVLAVAPFLLLFAVFPAAGPFVILSGVALVLGEPRRGHVADPDART